MYSSDYAQSYPHNPWIIPNADAHFKKKGGLAITTEFALQMRDAFAKAGRSVEFILAYETNDYGAIFIQTKGAVLDRFQIYAIEEVI